MSGRTEHHQRYVAGRCIDCGEVPHSAGRPRCSECHLAHVPVFEPGLKRVEKKKRRAAA
jgi:hypothetical protein